MVAVHHHGDVAEVLLPAPLADKGPHVGDGWEDNPSVRGDTATLQYTGGLQSPQFYLRYHLSSVPGTFFTSNSTLGRALV